jgi:nitric oxide reductase NorD protein
VVDLEWELHAFKGLMALWKRLRPAPPPAFDSERVVHAQRLLPRLQLIARMVAEAPVRVVVGRDAGGVRGLDILLPPHLDVLPTPAANEALYILRAALSGAMVRVLSQRQLPLLPADEVQRRLLLLDVVADACDLLAAELSGAGAALDEVLGLLPIVSTATSRAALQVLAWQKVLRQRPWRAGPVDALVGMSGSVQGVPPPLLSGDLFECVASAGETTNGKQEQDDAAAGASPTTTLKARPVTDVRRTAFDEEEQKKSALMHTFEKVETLDTSNGAARDGDGSDELEVHEEALQEVDLRDMVRGGEHTAGMLHTDIELDADVPDVGRLLPGERGVPYDEWDHRARAYRAGWCTVYPTPIRGRDPAVGALACATHHRTIDALHTELLRLRHERRPTNRQLTGPDIDIDACVDDLAARTAGNPANERLYVRRERHRRSLSTTVLLDVSLSSDAWVDGRRVLDVARDVVVILGEVATRLGDDVEVLAFASETRNHCRVYEVGKFGESWRACRDRLGVLRPQGYTRIGPALRHAIARAARLPTQRHLVLLVSDGKPTDYDRYEGRYGVADVRQALREGEQRGVRTHALAIDAQARAHLPEMFGTGAWHVLQEPGRLLEVMRTAWARVAS